jgi:hypothetical protein
MKDLLHVTGGGGCCLLRTAAALSRAEVGRVPILPVVLGGRFLVAVVVLRRLAQEFCKACHVGGARPRQLPLAAGKPRRDLLEQPAIPVRILERGKRVVGTTLRVTSGDARVVNGVVEGAASVVENLTSTPRAIRSSRAASRSSTARTRLPAEPGLADVTPLPKMIEACELCGVTCTPRKSSLAMSASSRQPRFS